MGWGATWALKVETSCKADIGVQGAEWGALGVLRSGIQLAVPSGSRALCTRSEVEYQVNKGPRTCISAVYTGNP